MRTLGREPPARRRLRVRLGVSRIRGGELGNGGGKRKTKNHHICRRRCFGRLRWWRDIDNLFVLDQSVLGEGGSLRAFGFRVFCNQLVSRFPLLCVYTGKLTTLDYAHSGIQ